jgi:hypothetical protein
MARNVRLASVLLIFVCLIIPLACFAQEAQKPKTPGYDNTPYLPGNKWRVHDNQRPYPPVITPGTFSTQDVPGKPPSDAVVLFDGTDLSKWKGAKTDAAPWKVENGNMEVVPKTGAITTRDVFGDCQLHIEWSSPVPATGSDQNRGNSGVFLMGLYEVQVLDTYQNVTYADGHAGAIYGQYPPLVNVSRPPGQWQVYDILFTAPRFKDGKLETPAYMTILHNGVVVHNHAALLGPTRNKQLASETPHDPTGPIQLQDHNHKVRFRNIWIRPIKGYDER